MRVCRDVHNHERGHLQESGRNRRQLSRQAREGVRKQDRQAQGMCAAQSSEGQRRQAHRAVSRRLPGRLREGRVRLHLREHARGRA